MYGEIFVKSWQFPKSRVCRMLVLIDSGCLASELMMHGKKAWDLGLEVLRQRTVGGYVDGAVVEELVMSTVRVSILFKEPNGQVVTRVSRNYDILGSTQPKPWTGASSSKRVSSSTQP